MAAEEDQDRCLVRNPLTDQIDVGKASQGLPWYDHLLFREKLLLFVLLLGGVDLIIREGELFAAR